MQTQLILILIEEEMILKTLVFPIWILMFTNPEDEKNTEISYFKNGEVSTISHYRGGELVKYIDIFPSGQKFQKIKWKEGNYHGVHKIWNMNGDYLVNGIMKNGKPWRGQFEIWSEEKKEYLPVIYKKGIALP